MCDGWSGEEELSLLVYMYIVTSSSLDILWPYSLMIGSMAEEDLCGRAFIGGARNLLVL
jgi:hypothetical protein